jgi:predicted  nucleic acid-binding Zn-ribbon protein
MIRELTCYRCQCEKCGHQWTTKSNDLPRVCSKCKSVAWNEGCAPAPYVAEAIPDEDVQLCMSASETVLSRDWAKDDPLANFIAKAQAKKGVIGIPISEIEPVAEEWKFTKEPVWYDDTNTPYRRQWMGVDKPVYRVVEVDDEDHDSIVRIK